jgi:hypothetical protein
MELCRGSGIDNRLVLCVTRYIQICFSTHYPTLLSGHSSPQLKLLVSRHIRRKEVVDILVSLRVCVLQIETMACARNNDSLDRGVDESLLSLSWDAAASWGAVIARSATVRYVALASDDDYGSLESVWRGGLAANSQEFADCHWLASGSGILENRRVEVAR